MILSVPAGEKKRRKRKELKHKKGRITYYKIPKRKRLRKVSRDSRLTDIMYDFDKTELRDIDICKHIAKVSSFNYKEVTFVYNMIFYLIYLHLQEIGNSFKFTDIFELENRFVDSKAYISNLTKELQYTNPKIELIVRMNQIFESRKATPEELDEFRKKKIIEETY